MHIYFFYQPPKLFCRTLLLLFLLFLCFLQFSLCTHILWVVLVVRPPCLQTSTHTYSCAYFCLFRKRKVFWVAAFSLTVCSSVVTLSSPSCSWEQMSLLWKYDVERNTTMWDGRPQRAPEWFQRTMGKSQTRKVAAFLASSQLHCTCTDLF